MLLALYILEMMFKDFDVHMEEFAKRKSIRKSKESGPGQP